MKSLEKKMHLNSDGQVYKPCCMAWVDPRNELWIPRDDGRVDIVCINHPEVHLEYEDDLPENN